MESQKSQFEIRSLSRKMYFLVLESGGVLRAQGWSQKEGSRDIGERLYPGFLRCCSRCFSRTWTYALSRARHLNVYARAYKRRLLALVHDAATTK